MSNFGIYVHIPFCKSKCKYCSFVSGVHSCESQKKYFENLKQEIQATEIKEKITSIFFGGGTPSSVESGYVCEILSQLKQQYKIQKNAEISLECNPNSANIEKLSAYKNAGFNRISFGGQSFDDNTLKILGRKHNANQIFEAIDLAKNAGFDNINLDLILGVNSLDENFEKNIIQLKNSGLTHISCYMLILEKGTPLYTEVKEKNVKILTDEEVISDYYKVIKILEKNGFMQYEISNFSLKNYQCKHNLNYWSCGQYQGFGLSAHSYVKNIRYANTSKLEEFNKLPFSLKNIRLKNQKISRNKQIEEYIMLALRTSKGIKLEKLKSLSYDILEEKQKEIAELLKNKAIKITKTNIRITQKYLVLSNQIILKLI